METGHSATVSVHKPEIKEKLFFLGAGLLMSVPFTLFFSEFTNSLCVVLPLFFAQVCAVVFFAPFIEEIGKVFPLFYRHGETERSLMDLGILVGLGFGLTEFFLYVFTLGEPILARIPGIIFHASSAAITTYGITKKKPVQFYLIAVVAHLSNNLFALLSRSVELLYIPALFLFFVTYLLAGRLYQRTSETVVL